METIFDIATPEELDAVIGPDQELFGLRTRDLERESIEKDPEWGILRLCELFAHRKDQKKAEEYLGMLEEGSFYWLQLCGDLYTHGGPFDTMRKSA